MSPKLIRMIAAVLALFSIVLLAKAVWDYYTVRLPQNNYSTIRIVAQHVRMVTSFVLPVVVLIMAWRSRIVNSLYLALAMGAYSLVIQLPVEGGFLYFVSMVLSIITGNLFILSMQYFPVKITSAKLDAVIKPQWVRAYLKTWLKPRHLWIGMTAILFIISVLEYLVPALQDAFSNLLILLTGFAYLYINFRLTTGAAHAKILWLFWGLLMYTLTFAVYVVISVYTPSEPVAMIILMLQLLALLFSFVMSVFFADAFDTGVLVRKTAINALVFLIALFMYNTVEHFVLHWLAHTLHISDAMLSSLLSGLLVLIISPLHHRLTGYLNKKLKAREVVRTSTVH